jgi:uncharacterized phage-associated protein
MAHNPNAAANWFIERGLRDEKPLTHIEVQKLLYFAHGWMLGIHERSLVQGDWEAWRYGPVLPEVYFNLNYNRGRPITERIPTQHEDFLEDELDIMEVVYGYRSLGTFTLVGVSHSRGGPWDRIWHSENPSNEISDELIRNYFKDLLEKNEASNG